MTKGFNEQSIMYNVVLLYAIGLSAERVMASSV